MKVRLHRARARLLDIIDRQIGVEARRLYPFDGWRCDRLVSAVLGKIAATPDPH